MLSTAREIIFLWVARMVMMGLEFVGEIPFTDVYIHSVIQAADGRRMSKSLGTGIDPLEMIDKYGADATRFGLLLMSSTQDVRFSEEKIAMGRSFANKLWNASRLVLLASEGCAAARGDAHQVDRWIASRFGRCVADASRRRWPSTTSRPPSTRSTTSSGTSSATGTSSSPRRGSTATTRPSVARPQGTRAGCSTSIVRLLHPFLPYVTEEVAAQYGAAPLLAEAHPRREDFAAGRSRRGGGGRPAGARQRPARVPRRGRGRAGPGPERRVRRRRGRPPRLGTRPFAAAVRALARTEVRFAARPRPGRPSCSSPAAVSRSLSTVAGARRSPVSQAQLAKVEAEVARCEAKLANEAFVGRAPEAIVAKERDEARRATSADRDELAARLAGAAAG